MKIIVLFLAVFAFLFNGAQKASSVRGISDDIEESKKRHVFLAEYMPLSNPMKINDTLQITVKEAWLECQWFYDKKKYGANIIKDRYQLCINTNENDLKGVCFNWTIGINFDKNIRSSSKNSLVGDFKIIPSDTLEYMVQKGRNLSEQSSKVILGKITLVKKRFKVAE